MSIKRGLIAAVLFATAGLSVFFINKKTLLPPPLGFLQSQFTSKGVVNRVIQLKLNYEEVKLNSERAGVFAEIKMPFDFSDKLYFKWKLGQDVILAEGELTGEINGLLKDEAKKIFLTVTGFSKENNHHIGFEIYGVKNGNRIYGDALIASDL